MKISKGVTLIELLVVIGIIGILTAIGFPTFNTLKNNYDLNASKKTVISALREAQSDTINQQVPHGIKFNLSSSSYSLFRLNDDSSLTTIWDKPLSPNLQLLISTPDSEVIFNPDGTAIHSGQIEITSTKNSSIKKILINPIGNINEE